MSRKNQFIASSPPVLAIILAMAVGTPLRAQMLVFDPSNYSQNLLTAARSLQQIQNQITSLQNQAQMLINQAKQLEQLPTTVLNDVERDYSQIQNLLKQANGITYNVQSLNQAYSQRYPVSISSATSDLQMIASAQQRWQDSLSAFQHSLTLGAGAVQNLPNTQAQTASLLASSQSSVGILQATQAGNQLVAVQTRQLADLTALLAAQGRSQALEQARKAEAEGQAQEQLRRFLSHWPGLPAANRPNVPLRPFDGRRTWSCALARWVCWGSCCSAPPSPCVSPTSRNRSASSPPSCRPTRSPPNSPAAENSGLEAAGNQACEEAWAENRARFFSPPNVSQEH